jgi:hypothetical protein
MSGRLLRVGAAFAACALLTTACGSRTPDVVGSWTASGECHLFGLARAEFAQDGGFRGAARITSMPEPIARARYGARYPEFCASDNDSALPVDGTWHQDGPRIVVETSGTFGSRVVLYHRVVDGTLTLASDGGFRDGVQTYERAK